MQRAAMRGVEGADVLPIAFEFMRSKAGINTAFGAVTMQYLYVRPAADTACCPVSCQVVQTQMTAHLHPENTKRTNIFLQIAQGRFGGLSGGAGITDDAYMMAYVSLFSGQIAHMPE